MNDVDEFEERRWEREGWQISRDKHVARLKGQQAALTTRRLESLKYIRSILPIFDEAYRALDLEEGEDVGGSRLAAQLTALGVQTQKGVRPTSQSDRGKSWANALRHELDAALIQEAVEECRTLMTARCLSADFENEELGDLERRYVAIIAEIINLGRRLRNQSSLSERMLLDKALEEARAVAKHQRREKPPVTMAARERFWRDRPPPVRKIFE